MKKHIKKIGLLLVLFLGILVGSNYWVTYTTADKLFSDTATIPYNKVGLVLGTSKNTTQGYSNLFFKYRIEAAVTLYQSGKIKALIVSGDNGIKAYNEAEDMKQALIAAGIPQEAIYMDYAGFRTYDSVIRAKEIFGQDSLTIIS